MNKPQKDGALHKGHRERMRQKLLNYGEHIFQSYELLEMLLFSVIRCRDTNDTAKRIFTSFKGADGVLTASPKELTAVSGVGERAAEFISTIGKMRDVLDVRDVHTRSVQFRDFYDIGEYLLQYFDGKREPEVVLLLIDNGMELIEKVTMYNCEYGSAAVKTKDFVNKTLQYHASVAIIGFNHPHGPMLPTAYDLATKKLMDEAIIASGICAMETYLVTGNKYMCLNDNKFIARTQRPEARQYFASMSVDITSIQPKIIPDISVQTAVRGAAKPKALLSNLLSYTNKPHEAKAAAEKLLRKYGTLRNVLSAPPDELSRLSQISISDALMLNISAYMISRSIADHYSKKRLYSEEEIKECAKALFLGKYLEEIYAAFLDKSGAMTSCEFISSGTVNSTGMVPRLLIERAIKNQAHYIILFHNHPFGTTAPSDDDIGFTKTLEQIFLGFGLVLKAHYIVADNQCDKMDISAE